MTAEDEIRAFAVNLTHQFSPGDEVLINREIPGVVERVIFCRDMAVPLYLVEWWTHGEHKCREFNERDLTREADDRPRKGLQRSSVETRPLSEWADVLGRGSAE